LGTPVDLAVVLTILTDGGFVLWFWVIAVNMEICLEGAKAVGFLFWGPSQLVSGEVGSLG
jgi:hypothetical protein